MRSWNATGPTQKLPELATSFVGRQQELAELVRLLLLPELRLVTLTGPGGVGKTRLALRAAANLIAAKDSPEVVWLSLAAIDRPAQLTQAIGEAFGLRGIDDVSLPHRLASLLIGREVVLLLDGFERLNDANALVASLIATCPSLKLLITSRGPLRIDFEQVRIVEPLDVAFALEDTQAISASPAVQLFVQRASARFEASPPTAEQYESIGSICRRLDGLPLAIELAAAWSRLLPPAQLLQHLDRRLPILTAGPVDAPERLQTMRAAIGWSYDFLEKPAQDLFGTLCIFAGAFSLGAAQQVLRWSAGNSAGEMGTGPASGTGLKQLLAQSLVRSTAEGRFMILQTIREFGLEMLEQSGKLQEVRHAHLAWCAGLVGEPEFEPLDGYIWPGPLIASEQAELTAALSFAFEIGDTPTALKLTSGLAPLWVEQGRYSEARFALGRITRESRSLNVGVRAVINGWEAEWAWLQGDYQATWDLASTSLVSCRDLGLDHGTAANLYRMGRVVQLSDPRSALPLLKEALDLFHATGATRGRCWCEIALAHVAVSTGELVTAKRWLHAARESLQTFVDGPGAWLTSSVTLAEARLSLVEGDLTLASNLIQAGLATSRQQRNPFYASLALALSCQLHLIQGNLRMAATAGREGLQIGQQVGSMHRQWQCLDQLASVASAAKLPDRALLLSGAASAISARLQVRNPLVESSTDQAEATFASRGNDERSDRHFWAGTRLAEEEILAEVLALELDLAQPGPAEIQLTSREREILSLVASGASNLEISDRLFVSGRKLDMQISAILEKLQVTSRHEAVDAARTRGLLSPNE